MIEKTMPTTQNLVLHIRKIKKMLQNNIANKQEILCMISVTLCGRNIVIVNDHSKPTEIDEN